MKLIRSKGLMQIGVSLEKDEQNKEARDDGGEAHNDDEIGEILLGIDISFDFEANNSLMVRYTKKEVLVALREMGLIKASSEDRFSALIFQQY